MSPTLCMFFSFFRENSIMLTSPPSLEFFDVLGARRNVAVGNAQISRNLFKSVFVLSKSAWCLKRFREIWALTNGYVATSAKDIEELKRRGEVNIIEFSLKKEKKNMHKVGDISLQLRKNRTRRRTGSM